MKVIYKYKLEAGLTKISLPKNAQFLSVQAQLGSIVLWFECDASPSEFEEREFIPIPTGAEYQNYHRKFLGTVQFGNGSLIFHIFETF